MIILLILSTYGLVINNFIDGNYNSVRLRAIIVIRNM